MKLFAMLMAALLSLPALAGETDVEFARTVEGHIEIAADGSVRDYSLDDSVIPEISAALKRNIDTWRFEPILVDGKPVIAQSRMRIALGLVPLDGDRYGFRIAKVYFGSPSLEADVPPPNYPASARRARVSGKVVLVLKLDDEGGVDRVHVERVDLERGSRSEAREEHWRKVFAASASRVARHWRFKPGMQVGGETVGGSVRVPVVFQIGRENGWRAYEPGPYVAAPWVEQPQDDAEHIARLENGQAEVLDSPFRLLGDVIGSTL